MPNVVSNHLTSGLLKYISITGRYTSGINLFEKLRSREPEIASLLAKVYLQADEEVKAVRLLHEAIEALPMDYSLLDSQAHFCRLKARDDLALDIAKRSVISAPSEFSTWSRLAQVYIGLERHDLALLTLNSCPMFTYHDRDIPPMPNPDKIHLPVMSETICDEIDDSANAGDPDLVHPTLRRLAAANFKGTFAKAYSMLTQITKKVGWDQLLRIRSQVFVMEEEYRHEKHDSSRRASNTAPVNGSSSVAQSPAITEDGASPNASTTALNGVEAPVSKPNHTVTTETVHAGSDNAAHQDPDPSHETYESFRHKRLCERWLDNLFMVLYEDLRIFTIWRTEVSQAKAQLVAYKKPAEEWEIFASLAERLHYESEALEAWQQCLSIKFSPKALSGVMEAWDKEGRTKDVIGAVIRLICWQFRWYSEVCCTHSSLILGVLANQLGFLVLSHSI